MLARSIQVQKIKEVNNIRLQSQMLSMLEVTESGGGGGGVLDIIHFL